MMTHVTANSTSGFLARLSDLNALCINQPEGKILNF